MLVSLAYQLAVALPDFREALQQVPEVEGLDPQAMDMPTLFDM